MLRLKINHAPFSPPYIYSFSLRNPSKDEILLIKEKGFLVREEEGAITFSMLKENMLTGDHPLLKEILRLSEIIESDRWRIPLYGGGYLERNGRPLIMGILNVTPDSFYDGGRYNRLDAAVERALKMVEDGTDIVDIGGESTRPGSEGVSEEEEMERVVPVIEAIRKESNVPISVDTTKSSVAKEALRAGANMVNDISGFRFDPGMARLCAELDVPSVIMHTTGKPKDMQSRINYTDLVWDILDYLHGGIELLEREEGKVSSVIVDPGIGFGKTPEDNLVIINRLVEFKSLGRPVLLGASRKSFIGKVLGLDDPEDRLEGSLSVFSLAVSKGIDVLRVHDVKESRRAVDMAYYTVVEGRCSRP